ncbi:hypothetical protein ADL03_16000 [Nocardia sp. NRRL S-836]|nr:hypothetical protein ADL03_16000 [Nocardia sp. NRRL S-836]
MPGQAQKAVTDAYGVPYTRFVQAVAPLAYDPEVIEAKPRETRLMREQMQRRRALRNLSRARGAQDPLRHARTS